MRIGLISDSESFIPSCHTLAALGLQVYLYFLPSPDQTTNQYVRNYAKQSRITVTEEKNKEHDLYRWMIKGCFDVCFVFGYKHRIKLEKLANCPTPLYNVHFGSLPSFRGPSPVFWQLKKGVEKISACIHCLTQRFDDGPVVWIKETENRDHFCHRLATQVLSRICVEGVAYITSLVAQKLQVPVIDRGLIVPEYQKRPGLADVMVDWQSMKAEEICNLIRACNPWNKGAITFFKGEELKLMDAMVVKDETNSHGTLSAGSIIISNNRLYVSCIDEKLLNINMLFYQDIFVPAYSCEKFGFSAGNRFSNMS